MIWSLGLHVKLRLMEQTPFNRPFVYNLATPNARLRKGNLVYTPDNNGRCFYYSLFKGSHKISSLMGATRRHKPVRRSTFIIACHLAMSSCFWDFLWAFIIQYQFKGWDRTRTCKGHEPTIDFKSIHRSIGSPSIVISLISKWAQRYKSLCTIQATGKNPKWSGAWENPTPDFRLQGECFCN